VAERDRRDASREHSPMVAAPDAVRVDTTGLTVDEVVERIVSLARDRAHPGAR
jgi:cytidylate kinase